MLMKGGEEKELDISSSYLDFKLGEKWDPNRESGREVNEGEGKLGTGIYLHIWTWGKWRLIDAFMF